jgi:hypothetical protein
MRADGFEFLNLNLNFFEFTNECRQLPMHLNFEFLNSLTLSIYLRYEYGTY